MSNIETADFICDWVGVCHRVEERQFFKCVNETVNVFIVEGVVLCCKISVFKLLVCTLLWKRPCLDEFFFLPLGSCNVTGF